MLQAIAEIVALLFSRTFFVAMLPAAGLSLTIVWRGLLANERSGLRKIPTRLLYLSTSSCLFSGLATGALKLAGCAHRVIVENPFSPPSAFVHTIGTWALRSHVFGWQFNVRVVLTVISMLLAAWCLCFQPRWPGVVAALWAAAALVELSITV